MQVEPQGNPAPQAGQGNSAPEAGQGSGDDAPKYVTVDDLNRAITARQKALENKLDGKFGEFKTSFETFQASIAEALKPKQDPPKESPKDKGAPPSVTETPEFIETQKQLKALQAKYDAAEKKATESEMKRRDTLLRQTVDETLAKAGVDSARLKHARGFLVDAMKSVRFSEDGESVVMVDSDGNESDLSAGIKAFLKSDDGKIYLPPRGTAGSGDRGGGGAPRAPGQAVTRESVAAGLLLAAQNGEL